MSSLDLKEAIKFLRKQIENEHYEFDVIQYEFKYIDDYLNEADHSDLEKAFFLILHRFPGDTKSYIVRPNEMVLIPDIYDLSAPGIEYEINFALYGGSITNPVKVAIECDGIRSHREKYNNKDRRKNVNLQAANWIVMRFGSREIHEELINYKNEKLSTSSFLYSIENTIQQKLELITDHTYGNEDYRSKLTGYKWGSVQCINCKAVQIDKLNHKSILCRTCNKKFKRVIHEDEKIEYEMNGILFFKH